ncbi:MAG: thiolase C-terminal domain-containing protein [Promethearchaeota archaeon]
MTKIEIDRIAPPLKRKVYVLGAEQTKFSVSKRPKNTLRDLASEAVSEVYKQSGAKAEDVDLLIVSNAVGFIVRGQGHMNALIANSLGLDSIPSVRVETACASGSVGFRLGVNAIEAGWADNVLIVGTEVMSGMDRNTTQKVISGGGDSLLESPVGATFPGLYATYAMAIFEEQKVGVKEGQQLLSYIALKNHKNASYNPKAQFNVKIEDIAKQKGIDDVWEFLNNPKTNPPIAWPLRLFDCSPISDGGAAVLLSAKDSAETFEGVKNAIELKVTAQATGYLPMGNAPKLTSLKAADIAATSAYKRIGLDINDPLKRISVAEVHDCFTSAEVLAIGDLHFFKRNETLFAAKRGDTDMGGKIPVNTSGGLKAKGHPIGVTGLSQIATLRHQLLGEMPKEVQVKDIDLALQHNVGGTGGTAVVNIFSLPEVD